MVFAPVCLDPGPQGFLDVSPLPAHTWLNLRPHLQTRADLDAFEPGTLVQVKTKHMQGSGIEDLDWEAQIYTADWK